MKKSLKVALIFAFLASIFAPVVASANEIGDVVTPTGIMALAVVIPLIVVLVLLFMKVDTIIAGLAGGVLAILIGGTGLEKANKQMLEAIPAMPGITVPIINSAVVTAVFKAGGYSAVLTLAKRDMEGKAEYVPAFIVILLVVATYMSGIGGGSAVTITPLAFAVVGVVPELIAAMSLVTAVSFTASFVSLESNIVSKLGDVSIGSYVLTIRSYRLFFVALAIVLTFWGTKHKNIGFKELADDELNKESNDELFEVTLPATFLLFVVISGSIVNDLTGFVFFTLLVHAVLTLVLTFLCTDFSMNRSVEAMVGGSTYILTRLFQVGIFLAFINVTTQTGMFAVIAGVAENAPAFIAVPVAILIGILIGTPVGTYVGSILTSVLPVAVPLSFLPLALGFVAMGVGLGNQMNFVNITIQALSSSLQIPILGVVKGNVKWLSIASVLLLVIGLIFG